MQTQALPKAGLSPFLIDIAQRFQRFLRLYGYQPVELPVIELADLFLIKAGDQVVNKLFTVEHQGREFALRPEFTAAAAYHYLTDPARPSVARWQFQGYVFEDDPFSNHNVQRFNLGAELIGLDGSIADAEIIALAANGLSAFEVSEYRLLIGHADLMRRVLTGFKLDSRIERFLLHQLPALQNPALGKKYVIEQVNKLISGSSDVLVDEQIAEHASNSAGMLDVILDASQRDTPMGARTRHDIARRLMQKRQRAFERPQIFEALDTLTVWSEIALDVDVAFQELHKLAVHDSAMEDILREWEQSIGYLETLYGIERKSIAIKPALARSWDYYTGIVFELSLTDGTQIGGGGRYNELMRLIGGQHDIPSVGFAYYVDNLLANYNGMHHESRSVTIGYTENEIVAIQWAEKLRQHNMMVSVLPMELTDASDAPIVTVAADGTANINDKQHQIEDIEALVAALTRE